MVSINFPLLIEICGGTEDIRCFGSIIWHFFSLARSGRSMFIHQWVWFKKPSLSQWYKFKRLEISKLSRLCCCQLFCKQPCPDFKEVKPVMDNFMGRICSWFTTSTASQKVPRIRAITCSMFLSLVGMDWRRDHSSPVTLNNLWTGQFIPTSFPWQKLLPYCVKGLRRISFLLSYM